MRRRHARPLHGRCLAGAASLALLTVGLVSASGQVAAWAATRARAVRFAVRANRAAALPAPNVQVAAVSPPVHRSGPQSGP